MDVHGTKLGSTIHSRNASSNAVPTNKVCPDRQEQCAFFKEKQMARAAQAQRSFI